MTAATAGINSQRACDCDIDFITMRIIPKAKMSSGV